MSKNTSTSVSPITFSAIVLSLYKKTRYLFEVKSMMCSSSVGIICVVSVNKLMIWFYTFYFSFIHNYSYFNNLLFSPFSWFFFSDYVCHYYYCCYLYYYYHNQYNYYFMTDSVHRFFSSSHINFILYFFFNLCSLFCF